MNLNAQLEKNHVQLYSNENAIFNGKLFPINLY